ncbi:MAG TPA: outer membrane lipoprotein carrier protein LolA [Kofleriaceae bacterium]|nr:outer membrane lipoprotein carrier protein LolA [Kofleriaceae bacterium]
MTRRAAWIVLVALLARGGSSFADPPANLLSGTPVTGAALDPAFAHLTFDRLRCKFTEAKHVALLARPLTSSGTIYFDHAKGVARVTTAPKPQSVVVSKTTIRIKSGTTVETIPLDKNKDLKAFALVFPSLLRGDRAELDKAFSIALYGSDADWWALTFAPKSATLEHLVSRVIVIGRKSDPVTLEIVEASGDTTETQLTDLAKNGDVSDAEITAAFGN